MDDSMFFDDRTDEEREEGRRLNVERLRYEQQAAHNWRLVTGVFHAAFNLNRKAAR